MNQISRYPWIGNVPPRWDVVKISHTTYVKGRIGWHGLNTDEFVDKGPFCVTGTDIINGLIDWKRCYHVSEERYDQDSYIQLKENDLLLTKDGTIGKCGIVVGLEGKATLNSGLFVIRPKKASYNSRFLYWIIQSNIFDSFIILNKTGTTISHLYQNVFEGFRFPVPESDTQKQIADFLDKETTRIDTLISRKQKQIELLKEKRQAIITQAVTKGLDPNVKMKDSGVEWIGEIPEHWEVVPFKRMAILQRGVDLPSDSMNVGKYLVYGSNGPIGSHNKFNVVGPSITIGRSGSVGEVNYYKNNFFAHNTSLYIKHFFNTSPRFFYFLLLSIDIKSFSAGTAVGTLNRNLLHPIYIPSPDIKTQIEIESYLDIEMVNISKLLKKIIKSITLLKEYRSSLITHAVSGQIDIEKYEVKK